MQSICRSESDTEVQSKPFLKRSILDLSKLKEIANDNFKVDDYGTKFSKRVENTVGKGEIARYEQFLLSPHCFQKTYTADTQKPGLVLEWVKTFPPVINF